MSVDDGAASFLSTYLLVQKKPITYRLLSRERNLHVAHSRSALEEFRNSKSAKGKVKATWLLQGAKRDGEGEGRSDIVLVGEDRLEDLKATFDKDSLIVQIYALSPASPETQSLTSTDLGFFSTVPLTLSSDANYISAWEQADRGKDLGVIYNPAVKEGDPRAIKAAHEQAVKTAKEAEKLADAKDPAAAASSSKAVKKEHEAAKPSGKTEVPSKNTGTKFSAASGSDKKAGGLDFAKASAGKPSASKSNATAQSKKKPASQTIDDDDAEEGEGSDVEMAQIGYDDSDAEAETVAEKPAGSSRTKRADAVQPPAIPKGRKETQQAGKGKTEQQRKEQRKQLQDMMDVEDDHDGPGEAVPDVPAKGTTSTSTMQGHDSDGDVEMQDAEASTSQTPAVPQKRKIRRKKRTVRKERTKDAKGYTVTREVSDYESYSDWTESEETPAVKGRKSSSAAAAAQKKEDAAKPAQEPERPAKAPPAGGGGSGSKSPSPAKAAPPPAKAASAAKKGGLSAGGSGQSKLSSFFKKG